VAFEASRRNESLLEIEQAAVQRDLAADPA